MNLRPQRPPGRKPPLGKRLNRKPRSPERRTARLRIPDRHQPFPPLPELPGAGIRADSPDRLENRLPSVVTEALTSGVKFHDTVQGAGATAHADILGGIAALVILILVIYSALRNRTRSRRRQAIMKHRREHRDEIIDFDRYIDPF